MKKKDQSLFLKGKKESLHQILLKKELFLQTFSWLLTEQSKVS